MTSPSLCVDDLSIDESEFDIEKAAAIYREHGCLIVRGLLRPYVDGILADIERAVAEAYAMLPQAEKIVTGWRTPDGSLFLPAPEHFEHDKQIMCLSLTYHRSAAFFRSALDTRALDLAEAILGPDIEMKDIGQSLYKMPGGGHPKLLHQDSSYFEHRHAGPMAMLGYAVDTDIERGALHIVPGSFKHGLLPHVDTFSHLGLDQSEWPMERGLPVEGKAGDAIFFHVDCVHGSPNNVSGKPRPVFISRYRAANDYIVAGGTTTENRGDIAGDHKPAGQEGIMVRGFRSRLTE